MSSNAGSAGGSRERLVAENPQRLSASARAVQSLRRRLAEGSWSAGDRLPSEPALAAELGVSRVSVRAALAQLESEGLVNRRHGSGTYVNAVRPLVSSLHVNVGSDQLIKSTGHVPGISEMSWRQTEADEEIADRLALEVGAPVTIEHDYFAVSLLPEQPLSLGPSLYSFLSTICGVDVTFGIATLEPAVAGETYAPVFGVGSDELCLVIRQVDYDAAERPVSYSVEHHLAKAFDFQLVRQGPMHLGPRLSADRQD
jgi:GntR family transcriptional regulator